MAFSFQETTENYYKKIEHIVDKVARNKCIYCGSTMFTNGICDYCGNRNEKDTDLIQDLEKELDDFLRQVGQYDFDSMPINCFFTYLVPVMNRSEKVARVLNTYSYPQKYYDTLEKFYSKIKGVSPIHISAEEAFILKTELLFGKISPQDEAYREQIIMCLYFFLKNLHIANIIGYEAFCELIKKYVAVNITAETSKCYVGTCQIEEKLTTIEEEKQGYIVYGTSFKNVIRLLEQKIKDLFYNADYDLLLTIFHELVHTVQSYYSYMHYDIYRDKILASLIPEYYDDNYNLLSYEVQARIIAYKRYVILLESLGLKEKINPAYKRAYEDDCELMNNHMRIVTDEQGNKVKVNIREYFDIRIVCETQIFTRFPELSILYTIEEGKVVPKPYDELVTEAELVEANISMPEQDKKRVLIIYQSAITSMKHIHK